MEKLFRARGYFVGLQAVIAEINCGTLERAHVGRALRQVSSPPPMTTLVWLPTAAEYFFWTVFVPNGGQTVFVISVPSSVPSTERPSGLFAE